MEQMLLKKDFSLFEKIETGYNLFTKDIYKEKQVLTIFNFY